MFRVTVASVLTVVVAALSTAASVDAHPSGSWLYPPQVAAKLSAKGYPNFACTGRRGYRFTRFSRPDNLQTWQYRHFECFAYNGVGYPGLVYVCVHSLSNMRIAVTRVRQDSPVGPC
jgi:hypothetical protein